MRRFFVQPELLREGAATLGDELSRHLAVLRLAAGSTILLTDGRGQEAIATIEAVTAAGAAVTIGPLRPAAAVPPLAITIYQGMPKGDKLDEILQKATELGVARLVPFIAERSVSRPESDRIDRKRQRWEKIVQEAARQSGRSGVPTVGFANSLAAAVAGEQSELRIILWEEERQQGLRQLLAAPGQPESVAVIVGPEGGLTGAEVAVARAAGFVPVSLGRRILRTETAGPAMAAILQFQLGDIG